MYTNKTIKVYSNNQDTLKMTIILLIYALYPSIFIIQINFLTILQYLFIIIYSYYFF